MMMAHVSNNSGNNEWYTPSCYVDAARNVMGSIDTDPASNVIAQQVVKASTYFTKDDSGLDRLWQGNVWMNPPYSADLIRKFVSCLVMNIRIGAVSQFITLTNNATDTVWFSDLYSESMAFCFIRGRIRFIDPDGNKGASPLQGQVICYGGNNQVNFCDEFSQFGATMRKSK